MLRINMLTIKNLNFSPKAVSSLTGIPIQNNSQSYEKSFTFALNRKKNLATQLKFANKPTDAKTSARMKRHPRA